MTVKNMKMKGTWRDVADSARTTIGLKEGKGEPSNKWKKQILLSEHSPIRQLTFKWKWINLPYWVSVHFVRHWLGILHFVKTSRTDRTGIDREELKQGDKVDHECEANVQALINISRKRLCSKASKETREAWNLVKREVAKVDSVVASCMVPECVYRRGLCPEFNSCGYYKTKGFQEELEEYRRLDGNFN